MDPGDYPETLLVGGIGMVIWAMYIYLGYNDTWTCKITDSKRQGYLTIENWPILKFVVFDKVCNALQCQ